MATLCGLERGSMSCGGASKSREHVASAKQGARGSQLTPLAHLGSRTSGSNRSKRRWLRTWWLPQAGGGSGGGGSGGGGGGSGGGGGGGGGDDEEQPAPRKQTGAWEWQGWQDRAAADPQFHYKVVVELCIGVMANVIGDMASRPNWGLNELDFVFATLVVGSINNFAAVYLLAPLPASAAGAAPAGMLAKLLGDHYLLKSGAPTGHCFQPGFPLPARLLNIAYKAALFSVIGMGAGTVGTAMSNALLALRKAMDPAYQSPNQPPSIMGNAACWALHMAVSANLRYQVLNGLDMVLQPRMPSALFRLYASVVRGANNLAGGVTFVVLAKALGVQEAAGPVPIQLKIKAVKWTDAKRPRWGEPIQQMPPASKEVTLYNADGPQTPTVHAPGGSAQPSVPAPHP